MYQALYRKYRPKTFDEVVGQDVVITTLKNSISNDKISHAYLFSGPRGCGKTSIAKIFAKMVNCKNLTDLKLCNQCVCCTQQNDQNLDIIEMDAASNNGVDEIREINNKVNLVPSLGKYKVYIIDEVHMLTIGAFNALLKTLEEPPAHAIFILATTDPHKVPITILSRCQKFEFKKIGEETIAKKISKICENENISITDDAIREISRLGDGSLRDTLSILDQVISYAQNNITISDVHEVNGTVSQNEISNLIEFIINDELSSAINIINSYNENGKSIIKITEEIILYLRNAILAKTNSALINDSTIYQSINEKKSINKIIEYIEILNSTLLDMKKFANSKMLLELALIKIMNTNEKMLPLKNENTVEKLSFSPKKNFPGNNFGETIKKNIVENDIVNSIENEQVTNSENINKISTNKIINENNMSKLNAFIDMRVSNTLANFSKKDTNLFKNQIEKISDYVFDEKYGEFASIIADGELKAVGNDYAIFTYASLQLATLFNEKIIEIEKTIEHFFNNKYRVIAVDSNKWNQIKEIFNSKKQVYVYQDETIDYNEIISELEPNSDDNIQSLFGELVEYN